MKALPNAKTVSGQKVAIITALFAASLAIAASGAFFFVYSAIHGVTLPVMNTRVPGAVFGIGVLYLGVRYCYSVIRLRTELFRPDARFSWNNFRRSKTAKSR